MGNEKLLSVFSWNCELELQSYILYLKIVKISIRENIPVYSNLPKPKMEESKDIVQGPVVQN